MATSSPTAPDYLSLLFQRWRTVAICTAVVLAGALLYAFLSPRWYEARLTAVPSQRAQDAASALAAKLPIAGLGSAGSADVPRIRAVLTSDSVADALIEKFNLMELYEVERIEDARDVLRKHCSSSVDRISAVVTFACEDKDPKRAMEMAAYAGEVGNRVFARISASSAREERKFLEAQVQKAREGVDQASRQLREFQEKHKIVDLPEQSKAVISAMAAIKGDLLSKQLQLSYLSSFSSTREAGVAQLRQQIEIMESKLSQLESARTPPATSPPAVPAAATPDFFPEAMNVPELRYELEQLVREQKIQETIFFLLTQRFETARVDEARDTSTFQILDYPSLPTRPSRPTRRKIALSGLLGGVLAGCAFVLLPAWWRRRRFAP